MTNKSNYKDKITMKFNVGQLDRIIVALLNNSFNSKFVSNVKRLFSLFNMDLLKNDYEKEVRVYIINELTSIILDHKISDKDTILSFVDTDGKYYEDASKILDKLFEDDINDNELGLLDKQISGYIKYGAIIDNSTDIIDSLQNLQAENYDDLDDAVADLEGKLDTVTRDVHSAREAINNTKEDINLSDGAVVNYLGSLITKKHEIGEKIRTGVQYFNTMFDGGYERGRLYCVLGVAKGWKSGFLLNSALWAKKYNHLEAHDPKLKPCIVYLSMENSTEETMERIWAHCFGNNSRIENYDKLEAAKMLEESGIFTPNDPNSPELLIWYKPNRSISTADLNNMLEDLKEQGKECVFLVVDYLRRIRPAENDKDLRIQLSNATNELKTIAVEQDIPVLTGSQLNRDAIRSIEEADGFEAKIKASDKLGAQNISESLDIVMNTDYAITINRLQNKHINADNEIDYIDRFLTVKLIACRGKQPAVTNFRHPFAENNDMKLIEDVNLTKPVSIVNTEDMIDMKTKKPVPTGPRQIKFGN